jgi:hypothetical protein
MTPSVIQNRMAGTGREPERAVGPGQIGEKPSTNLNNAHFRKKNRVRTAAVGAVSAALISALATACSGGQPAPSPTSPVSSTSPTSSCQPGVGGAENWIMGNGELSAAQSASPSSVRYALSPAHLLVLDLRGQSSSAGQNVADFRSYAEFKKMIKQGTIPAGIHWVMYDNEQWSLTPADEQADPVRYEELFARLAHQYGYKVILAPAQDLVAGFDKNSFQDGHAVWQSYLSMGLASASARVADIYEIQAQPYEIGVYRSQHAYASFVAAAVAQARSVNPGIVIYAGLSTQRVSSAAQLIQDYLATRDMVQGYWLNIPQHNEPAPVAVANQFFRDLPAAASASGPVCART